MDMIDKRFRVDEKRPFHGKFWPKGIPYELDYDYSMTLGQMFDEAVEKHAEKPLIYFLNTWVSYKELKEMVDSFATYLHNIGVKKGDVVAIDLPNCIQYEVAYYAIIKLGAICIGVNPTYKPKELLYQMKLSGAKVIIVLDILYKKIVSQIEPDWKFDKVIYTNFLDLASGISPIAKFIGKYILKKIPTAKIDLPNAIKFTECLKTEPNVPNVEINPETDPAILSMTGGTTGIPKAATISHRNLLANIKQISHIFLKQVPDENTEPSLGYRTGFIGVLPLFHCYAMIAVMNISIDVGGWQILFPRPPPPKEFLKTIYKLPNENRFVYYAVEYLLAQITESDPAIFKKYPLTGRIAICGTGGGVLHDYIRKPFESNTGAYITEGYGLSEATAMVSANNIYGEREPGYIGTPASSTDWDIFDIEDFSKGPLNILGEEGVGEICVTGPQIMMGYWNNPEATTETIKEWDGRKWLLTGDIGYMEKHGRIKIIDRKKELIKMSGRSVYPSEVESIIGEHPAVLEVGVAAVPDEKTGEAVKAWVVIKPDQKDVVGSKELYDWFKDNMAYWKIPKYIEFIEEVPKTLIGKIAHRALQEADPLWKNRL
jgi:long-chain acyl-CoA synthetase